MAEPLEPSEARVPHVSRAREFFDAMERVVLAEDARRQLKGGLSLAAIAASFAPLDIPRSTPRKPGG